MVERRTHPGWVERIKLDKDRAAADGADYTEAVALLIRDGLLWQWANDERNAQWHPAPEMFLRIEAGQDFSLNETWMVGRMDAIYRPATVAAELLDHVHTADCDHVLVPFVTGHCCDHCGNMYLSWRLCPLRCPVTYYAGEQLSREYHPPGRAS